MTKCLLLALSLPLLACTVGGDPGTGGGGTGGGGTGGGGTGGGGGGGGDVDGGGGTPAGFSGTVTADVTWSGTFNLLGQVDIKPGVTVTVAPGTTVAAPSGLAQITVEGTLLESGAKGSLATFNDISLSVPQGGTVTATYAVHTGGDIQISTGGTVNLTDTVLSHAGGDFLTMSGGTINMDYSQIGVGAPTDATKGADTTHCDMHFNNEPGTVVKVQHSNIASSSYGIMLYADNADLSLNNWYTNQYDFEPYTVTGGKADGGWFKAANGSTTYTPTGVQGVTFANLSATPLPNGPR